MAKRFGRRYKIYTVHLRLYLVYLSSIKYKTTKPLLGFRYSSKASHLYKFNIQWSHLQISKSFWSLPTLTLCGINIYYVPHTFWHLIIHTSHEHQWNLKLLNCKNHLYTSLGMPEASSTVLDTKYLFKCFLNWIIK